MDRSCCLMLLEQQFSLIAELDTHAHAQTHIHSELILPGGNFLMLFSLIMENVLWKFFPRRKEFWRYSQQCSGVVLTFIYCPGICTIIFYFIPGITLLQSSLASQFLSNHPERSQEKILPRIPLPENLPLFSFLGDVAAGFLLRWTNNYSNFSPHKWGGEVRKADLDLPFQITLLQA